MTGNVTESGTGSGTKELRLFLVRGATREFEREIVSVLDELGESDLKELALIAGRLSESDSLIDRILDKKGRR